MAAKNQCEYTRYGWYSPYLIGLWLFFVGATFDDPFCPGDSGYADGSLSSASGAEVGLPRTCPEHLVGMAGVVGELFIKNLVSSGGWDRGH